MTTVQYLLDENVDLAYLHELARHEPTLVVRFVGQIGMPPKRTRDPDILVWCEEHSFVLVTNNRRTM
jgi:hypothetical protein